MQKIYTFVLMITGLSVFPQAGFLDPSFGDSGKVHTGFGNNNTSRARAVAVQPDGKVIVGGSAYTANTVNSWEKDSDNTILIRYNTDGTIDNSFGTEGKVMSDFYSFFSNNNRNGAVYAIRVQTDGKILAYGSADSQTMLTRYNADGSIDNTFGINGKVLSNMNTIDGGNAIAIQPDGKIVILGTWWIQPTPTTYNTQFVLERYNTDGTPDTTFATNGRLITIFGAGYDTPKAITLQADGKIIAVGKSYNNNFAIARYTTNGALDTTFDGDGKLITSFGSGTTGIANFVTAHPDGKIVVTGTTSTTTGPAIAFAVAKYNANGSLDTSFDGDGKATAPLDAGDASVTVTAVARQDDGKFLVTTTSALYGMNDVNRFTTRRYNANGSIDTGFGTNGKVDTEIGSNFSETSAIAVQANGNILVAGYYRDPSSMQNSFALVRYGSNGTPDVTFGIGGKAISSFDSTNDESTILLAQPDGKLIAIGTRRYHTPNNYLFKDIAISRYNSGGNLDATFGNGGKVVSVFGQNINTISKAVLQPDGKIVILNTYYNLYGGDGLYHYEIIRYTTTGSIDTAFGTNGKVVMDMPASVLVSQPDGKIIVGSINYDTENNTTLILRRYASNGTPDAGFGNNGITSVAITTFGDPVAVLQGDGKILVAYSTPNPEGLISIAIKRFTTNGSTDSDFTGDLALSQNGTYVNAIFMQPDGKFIVTGKSVGITDGIPFYQFVSVRYTPGGSLDTTYGANGIAATISAARQILTISSRR